MNVKYSDTITGVVKELRKSVYDNDSFKKEFSNALTDTIGAVDVSYIPDQFGGWSVNVTTDRAKGTELGISNQDSTSYLTRISKALTSSIRKSDTSVVGVDDNVANNLANVVVTGHDSLTIKL